MKKRLYILAPNDRFNYGDLLFPYILKFYFSDSFDDIVYVSTTKSDLTKLGGFKTEKYTVLYQIDENWENHLIVAGGEALCVDWFTILSFVNPWINLLKRITRVTRSEKISKYCNLIIRNLFHIRTHFAFSVGKNELPEFKSIVYNALGGSWILNSSILNNTNVKKILSSVDYITVRDADTSLALKRANIKHSICPDSAILMSEVFSEEILLDKISIDPSLVNTKYIFFQGNIHVWKNEYKSAANQLNQIIKQTQYKICLCPIGTALGHSDQIALKNISKYLSDKNYIFINEPNIFDIMWLIKHSQIYLGSSLHGVITAMSFSVPFIGYGPQKLKSYIRKWSDGFNGKFAEKSNLKDMLLSSINIKPQSQIQKDLVKLEFENIKNKFYTNR